MIAIDVKANRVVGDIADVPGAHGVLAVPERGRVYATATDDNALVTLDPGSLRVTATVSAGDYADGIAYDPKAIRLFISDEQGGTVTVVDALSNRRLGSVDLGGEVGNTQYDAATHLVVAAAQGRGELAAIDPVRMAVVRRYPTPGCGGPHGLLISPDGSTAFVACEQNARLVTSTSTQERSAPRSGSATRRASPDRTPTRWRRTRQPTSSTCPCIT